MNRIINSVKKINNNEVKVSVQEIKDKKEIELLRETIIKIAILLLLLY